ncbi:MAG TPA: NAD(P)/FAD-dependent oxidoreductase [Acidimicrobiales bacterium]|nr:NAD(P)/FAD-dependent oxidoreductase [Acidimicrobiales bacterium]
MFDAIVVGSRCAGAPTAMLLARRGRRVLLVDRATFPSDTLSGHAIQPAGVARLARWGLLDRLVSTGVPAVERMSFDFGPVCLRGTPPPADGNSSMYVPRRTILDTLLVEAAAEAGAEIREGFTVKELVFAGDRVVGVRGRDRGGRLVEERAGVVIGADGMHSFVARAVGAPSYNVQPVASVAAYSYWSGVDLDGGELYVRPNRFFVTVPTHDDLVIVAQTIAVSDANAYRDDIEGAFMATLETAPSLAARIGAGTRVERFRLTNDTGGFFRTSHGPGWALVGDAGYHKDPVTAQGMLDAFRDADLLSAAVDEGLDGNLERSLAHYQASRDAAVGAMYDFTCQLAHVELPPPPEMQQLIGALVGNQPEIDRFFGVMAGSVPVTDFFAPENVQRLLAA